MSFGPIYFWRCQPFPLSSPIMVAGPRGMDSRTSLSAIPNLSAKRLIGQYELASKDFQSSLSRAAAKLSIGDLRSKKDKSAVRDSFRNLVGLSRREKLNLISSRPVLSLPNSNTPTHPLSTPTMSPAQAFFSILLDPRVTNCQYPLVGNRVLRLCMENVSKSPWNLNQNHCSCPSISALTCARFP